MPRSGPREMMAGMSDERNARMPTRLIHGRFRSPHWDYRDHIVPPISASAAYRLESTARGAEGFLEFANPELNREQLLPSHEQVQRAEEVTQRVRARMGERMKIYFVVPDYFERRPKPCMNGLGSVFLTIAPDGVALPCHSARMLPGLTLPSVREANIDWIWYDSPGFNAYRGDAWMREPCRTCPEKTKDFGGCRCQAFMLTGDAANADPVCDLSPYHHVVTDAVKEAQQAKPSVEARPIVIFRDDKNSRELSERAEKAPAA